MVAGYPPWKKKCKTLCRGPDGAIHWVAPFFMMSLHPLSSPLPYRQARSIVVLILLCLSACSPAATPTPFRPPTLSAPLIEPTFIILPTQEVATSTPVPEPTPFPTVNPAECVNDLTFIADLTIPDNTFTTFGSTLDKQWLVENSGSCHWTAGYRLRHIGGAVLGAPEEIALYPARSGTQATVRILFTAPFTEGIYESAWQAFDTNGDPFGDPIYISVVVQ